MPAEPRKPASSRKAKSDPFLDPEVAKTLGHLIQSSPGTGAWIWNLSSDTVHWSREVYRLFDAPEFDNRIETFRSMVLPEDRERGIEVVTRALASRETFHVAFRVKTSNGELLELSNVGQVIYDKAGKPRTVVGLVSQTKPDHEVRDKLYDTLPRSSPERRSIESIRELRDHLLFVRANPFSPDAAKTDEMALSFLLQRIDAPKTAKLLASRLLRDFSSMADVLSADRARISAIDGIREDHLHLFDIARYSMELVLHPKTEPLKFDNSEKLIRYLRISHAYQAKEQLRVLFLDRGHHVIASELMQEGTVDHTPVYTREIIKRALELSASFLVLVHNHPSGDPTPSIVDIELTKSIAKVALTLGITVQDHVILGRYGHVSLADRGMI